MEPSAAPTPSRHALSIALHFPCRSGSARSACADRIPPEEIPRRLRPLTLPCRPIVERYLAASGLRVCELTFASLFSWDTTYPHYLGKDSPHLFCETGDHLLIGFFDRSRNLKLYQPIGPDPAGLIEKLNAGSLPLEWICVEEEVASKVQAAGMDLDRDNSDYLYRLAEIRALKGKKYHRKRTYIRHCEALRPAVLPLTAEHREACIAVNRQWLAAREHPHDTDATALERSLAHFEALQLHGIVVAIDGIIRSFAIGEPLNGTMFVSHFLKASMEYPGLFQFTAHAFARSIPERFVFLNKEQDLGIEGLREAKEGWCPCAMVHKYTIRNGAQVAAAGPASGLLGRRSIRSTFAV